MTSNFIIPDEVRVKILMFGRGVIATVHGWALERAGHDIEFYVRPGRASAYGEAVELDLLDARRRVWGQRVVQAWRVAGWDPGVYSVVRFTLRAEGGKTRFVIDHDAYPAAQHDHLSGGWLANYIEPLTAYFARAACWGPTLSGQHVRCDIDASLDGDLKPAFDRGPQQRIAR